MKAKKRVVFHTTVAVLIMGCFLAAPAFSKVGANESMELQMLKAAERIGLRIQTEEMVTLTRDRATFALAVIDGFENVPATALPKGVDFAFAFIDAPQSGIPTGHYTRRASTPDPQLGENDATVELIDENGRVVSQQSSVIDVFSMEVPDEPLAPRSVVGTSLETGDLFRLIWISGYVRCPNGMWICFFIVIDDFWFWW